MDGNNNIDWLLFSKALVPEWCRYTEHYLKSALGFDIGLGLALPREEEAIDCMWRNTTLKGTLTLNAVGCLANIRLPLPIDGVFIASASQQTNQGEKRNNTYVWGNWLTERPGVRRVKLHNGDEELRLGFPDGSHWAVPTYVVHEETKKERQLVEQGKMLFHRHPYSPLWLEEWYPQQWLRNALEKTTIAGMAKATAIKELLSSLANHANDFDATEADDLEHRALMTFPRWLAFRLCRILQAETEEGDEAADLVRRIGRQRHFGVEKLVPIGLLAEDGLFANECAFVRISPCNPVELMASLTGVKRCRFRRKTAALLPEWRRQNHVSFDGRLCPLESPESDLIGLQLQLARGAHVTADGSIIPTESENMLDRLGWGASLIPFANYNDGARDMMGAKNLRQAVEIEGRQPSVVTTGMERELADKTDRLVRIGVCPGCIKDDKLALGRDLLVAYMPWYGWNVDDAVVVRRGIAETMSFEATTVFSEDVKAGWRCDVGIKRDDSLLHAGDVIATLSTARGEKSQVCYNDPGKAVLVKAPRPFSEITTGTRKFEYTISTKIPLCVGDKLMGRHGNKGVVGLVLDDSKMPHLPNDPSLPENMRGKHIDIILNPHGILSRMNPGQLLETHLGWLLHAGINETELMIDNSETTSVGNPSAQLNHDNIRCLLKETGLDRSGAIRLDLGDGRKTVDPVVVGYQHFVRLNHVPLLKAQARRGGDSESAYSIETHQPVRGRKIGGGMRLGEMEVWALAAYGANAILREMLGGKSDDKMARVWADKTQAPIGGCEVGFPVVLKHWLFALGIDMAIQEEGTKCKFSFLTVEDIVKRIGENHEISDASDLIEGQFTTFGLKEGYKFPGEYLVGSTANRISLDNFLAACGYYWDGLDLDAYQIVDNSKAICRLDIASSNEDIQCGYFEIAFNDIYSKSTKVTVSLYSCDGMPLLLNGQCQLNCLFKDKNNEFHKSIKVFREKGKVELLKKSIRNLLEKTMLCHPEKSSEELVTLHRGDMGRRQGAGSLYDASIFGPLKAPFDSAWGYIRLPRPIPNPLTPKPSNQDVAAVETISLPDIEVIPVLPLCYRMPRPESKTGNDVRSINDHYKEVLTACKLGGNAPEYLEKSVKNLFEDIAQRLDGKEGLLRHEGLGRRVDWSFRLVIAPNPELQWNQAGVPASILWEMLGDFVASDMDLPPPDTSFYNPQKQINGGFSWHNARETALDDQKKAEMLKQYLKRHPDTLILLNRQPSLHKYSFQAFHPIVTEDRDGEILRLSPLCCKGFAADFDGDEMVGFLPLSQAAKEEAVRLLPENNLLSSAAITKDGNPEPMLHYDRDFVTGLHIVREIIHGKQNSDYLANALGRMQDCCRQVLLDEYPEGEDPCKKIVGHICREHSGADAITGAGLLARLAWDVCTKQGFSFGFYDLFDYMCDTGFRREIEEIEKVSLGKDGDKPVNEAVMRMLRHTLDTDAPIVSSGCQAIALMVLYGANGQEQLPQIVACRGYLKGLANSKQPVKSSLAQGMDWKDLFDASWSARRSLCEKKLGSAKGGGLTRKLVLGLWPQFGVNGLVAAQSIGERGTQLAMKSIHAVEGVEEGVDILRAYIKGNRQVDDDFKDFLSNVTENDNNKYKGISEHHFNVLWNALRGGVFAEQNGWTDLLQGSQRDKLVKLAHISQCLPLDSPLAMVLFNLF